MPRSLARLLPALVAGALVLAGCAGTARVSPTAAIGSGGATGSPTGTQASPAGAGGAASPAASTAGASASGGTPGATGTAAGSPEPAASGSAAGASAGASAPAGSPAPADSPATSPATGAYPATSGAGADAPTIGIPGLGLSLRLPSGWVGLDSTVPPTILDTTAARHPDLAEPLASLRAGDLGFVGYDATSTGPTTPHVTIAITGDPITVATLLDALAGQTAAQLAKTASITEVHHAPVTLPAGPAAELRYHQKPNDGGPEVAIDSWFIATAGHTFLVAFQVPVDAADTWQPQLQSVVESLAGG